MFKHAYLLVANANFRVVEACLRMIDDPRNDIYLLLDAKSKVSEEQKKRFSACVSQSTLTFSEQIVNWGGWSQISAVLSLLKQANHADCDYSYVHFLQGSDLPIRSQDEIHAFFEANQGKEFVQIEKNRTPMAQRKAWYRHFFCHSRFFRTGKPIKALNFGLMELQKLLHIRKNTDIELYQGSALFSITGACAQYIESREREIHKRFYLSLAADEVFLQSMLMASPFRESIAGVDREVSENARLIDRTRPDGKNSPHIWRAEEADAILHAAPNKMFARKFDEKMDFAIVETICKEVASHEPTVGP